MASKADDQTSTTPHPTSYFPAVHRTTGTTPYGTRAWRAVKRYPSRSLPDRERKC